MSRPKTRPTNATGDWDFFAFPCVFTFLLGMFITVLVVGYVPFALLFVGSLFGTSFAMAHLIASTWRRRVIDKARQREEEDERERRALAARAIAAQQNEARSKSANRRRRNRGSGPGPNQIPPAV